VRFLRVLNLLALLMSAAPLLLAQNTITTVAGGGNPSGVATSADVITPSGVALDSFGNLYIGQYLGDQVFKVTPAGTITVFAGQNFPGEAGDGGPAVDAVFGQTIRVAVDANQNVYVADYDQARVRRIDAHTGIVTTVAGSATQCPGGANQPCGDGGLATEASLLLPEAIAFDLAGNMFISDRMDYRIRRVDAVTGIITTVAGNGVHCLSGSPGTCGDGGLATQAQLLSGRGIALDGSGNLFIADGQRIRRVDASTKIITTVALPPDAANYLIVEPSGNLLATGDQTVYRVNSSTYAITTLAGSPSCLGVESGDGGPAASACLSGPFSAAEDPTGNIYIGQTGGNRVRKVDNTAQHIISSYAGGGSGGDGGPATNAILGFPSGVTLDALGNEFIVDSLNDRIRRVDGVTKVITTVAGSGEFGSSGNGGPAASAKLALELLEGTDGVVLDSLGDLAFADAGNYAIRRVDSAGIITTIAGGSFCTDPTTPCGDGGPATAAAFGNGISGLAFDSSNDLIIGDSGDYRVRVVDPVSGIITTVAGNGTYCADSTTPCGDGGLATAASLSSFNGLGVAVDSARNVFIADVGDYRIRRVDAATGIITTVAGNGTACASPTAPCGDGGSATGAELYLPQAITLDGSGNLFIADYLRVRRVDAVTQTIATVAGNATGAFSGDGGPAFSANLVYPQGLWVDPAEHLFIVDTDDNRIREVPLTPTASYVGVIQGFGSQLLGVQTPAQSVTLGNTGGDTLKISSISVLGTGFASTNTCTGNTVAPLQNCTVRVAFKPTAVGTSAGSLTITTNAPINPIMTYEFAGTGSTIALTSIAVTPVNPSIAGHTQQFTATGTYSDGSTQNLTDSVTWTSGTTATATITATGLATGLAIGTSKITASSGSISGMTALTVTVPQAQPASAGPFAYVPVSGANAVSVFDVATNSLLKNLVFEVFSFSVLSFR
jgi:sugar lactone lactonase YvrE